MQWFLGTPTHVYVRMGKSMCSCVISYQSCTKPVHCSFFGKGYLDHAQITMSGSVSQPTNDTFLQNLWK